MNGSRRLTAVLVLLALMAAVCGGDGEETAPEQEVDVEQLLDCPDELPKLTLGFLPIVKFAFLPGIAAKELGYYEEFCIDMTVEPMGIGRATLDAAVAGAVDFAYPGTASTLTARGAGTPVKIVWGPADVLPQVIPATSGIESCEDLEGRTVATDGPGGLADFVMQAFLDSCGLDIDSDVERFIGSPADFGPVLSAGDAQASALHIDDVGAIEDEFGIELNILAQTWELLPQFHYQDLTVTEDFLETERDNVIRVVAALIKTNRFLVDPANRDEVISMAVELSGWDESIVTPAYESYNENWPTTCQEALNPDSFEFLNQSQIDLGNLDEPVPYDELVAFDVCQEAEALLEAAGP